MVGYELLSPPPLTASALMPPASQAVEQRPERHAGHTGHRWALRALVVGGLAGAAWILSGAAAHAADQQSADPAIGGISVGSPVRTLNTVMHAPQAVGARHRLTSAVVTPDSRPGTTKDNAVRSTDDTGSTSRGVHGVVLELTAPLRPTGGPVGAPSVTSVASALPMPRDLRPATDLPHIADQVLDAHGPVTAVTGLSAKVLTTSVTRPIKVLASPVRALVGPVTAPVRAPVRALVRPGTAPAPPPAAVTGPPTAVTGQEQPKARTVLARSVPVIGSASTNSTTSKGSDTERRSNDVDRHTAATTARPARVQPAPGSPEPVPVQVHLGAVSGIPSSGPGWPADGGCSAIVPAAVVAGTVACHRLPIATDVDVRRYDAGSPTVSPD